MIIRLFVGLTVIASLAGCSKSDDATRPAAAGPSTGAPPAPNATNVLLITLDTTRADFLGCYGYHRPTTPHLDALALDGARFDLAISASACTPPSHATILTGLFPYKHGVRVIYAQSGYKLPSELPTLATLLGERGWNTAAFLSSFTVCEFYGFERGFAHWDNGLQKDSDQIVSKTDAGDRYMWDTKANQRRSDVTTDAAIGWLRSARKPFCVWIHYWDPHDEGLVPPPDVLAAFPPEGPTQRDRRKALYAAEIHFVDQQIGRLVQMLKDEKVYDATAIVVLADHGEGLGDHDWGSHRLLYQEQIRVPLIVRLPGGPRGAVVPQLVRTADVLPTLLEAVGLPPSVVPHLDGRPLQPLLSEKPGARPDEPRVAYAEQLNAFDLNAQLGKGSARPLDDLLYCIADQNWKFIHRPLHEDKGQLFEISRDPRELDNVFETRRSEAERLRRMLDEKNPYRTEPFGQGEDEAIAAKLRSLGYVAEPTTRPATRKMKSQTQPALP